MGNSPVEREKESERKKEKRATVWAIKRKERATERKGKERLFLYKVEGLSCHLFFHATHLGLPR